MTNSSTQAPDHVAIIMDGNGRWAAQRGLPRIEGHRQGIETAKEVVRAAGEIGLRNLTLYAFSVENWKRPATEVNALMSMLERFLREETRQLVEKKIRLLSNGRADELPRKVRSALKKSMEATAHFEDRTLILALNYGSRTEIVDAVRDYSRAVANGLEDPEHCTWERLSRYFYLPDVPDPDLIIRTSGESRLSNFLLLQSAYAEIYFSPVLWPDFGPEEFTKAIDDFMKRERRFGQTGEQIKPAVPQALTRP